MNMNHFTAYNPRWSKLFSIIDAKDTALCCLFT